MVEKLWTKNFTLSIIGNIISETGGIGLNLALSIVVFQETDSTILNAIFSVITMLPFFFVPILFSPIVDRSDPLKLLLKIEKIQVVLHLLVGVFILCFGFNYYSFTLIIFITTIFSAMSSVTGQSILPQLIPKKFYSKGYSVYNLINPMCAVIVTPIAMYLINKVGVGFFFIIFATFTLIDVIVESNIDHKFEFNDVSEDIDYTYFGDIKDGYKYLITKKEILIVFIFFGFVMMASSSEQLIYPFFNRSLTLTDTDFSLLKSFQSAGYMFGGFFHYFVKITDKKRYYVALAIYFVFVLLDSSLLFMPFAIMCIAKFLLGNLGMNSANIRNTAVQANLDNKHRSKVNSVFSVIVSFSVIIGNLLAGFLGEYLDLRLAVIILQMIYLFAILFIFLPCRKLMKRLYNYKTD